MISKQDFQQSKEELEERYKPGTFGCHELLDRISIMQQLWDMIEQHPAAVYNGDEWHEKVQKISDAIADLYQAVGAKHLIEPYQVPVFENEGEEDV